MLSVIYSFIECFFTGSENSVIAFFFSQQNRKMCLFRYTHLSPPQHKSFKPLKIMTSVFDFTHLSPWSTAIHLPLFIFLSSCTHSPSCLFSFMVDFFSRRIMLVWLFYIYWSRANKNEERSILRLRLSNIFSVCKLLCKMYEFLVWMHVFSQNVENFMDNNLCRKTRNASHGFI